MNAKLYLTLGFVAFATAGFAQKPAQLVNRANYRLSSKVLQSSVASLMMVKLTVIPSW